MIVVSISFVMLSVGLALAESGYLSISMEYPDFRIIDTQDGQKIILDDCGILFEPGKPRLPSRIYPIALPPNAIVDSVKVISYQSEVLPGKFQIIPVAAPRVIQMSVEQSDKTMARLYERNFIAVYGSDDPYPMTVGEFVRQSHYRKYNLADVRVTPFSYVPGSGQLIFHRHIRVEISYTRPDSEEKRVGLNDYVLSTERDARELIFNYNEAQQWYSRVRTRQKEEQHPLVIITMSSLVDAVSPLADWESRKGNNPLIVTTDWIYQHYTGIDDAQKIRNFLREKYPSTAWGIENVLIVGHHDHVPMRLIWQRIAVPYGYPRSDFYYAELSKSDDQSWDSNQNGNYGEDSDSMDFYSEVNIGRIPWSDFSTVSSICLKSIQYEQNASPSYKKNILLLGAFFWMDTDNAVLMEAKINQSWMSDWTITKLYQKNINFMSIYDCDYPLLQENVNNVWPNNTFAFVNWAGHGLPTSAHICGLGDPPFISSTDCQYLNDDFPAIIFADSCSNADTDELNIGQAMLKQGAVGFVGATKAAWGLPGWSYPDDGSSQSLDYYFTTYVTSHQYTQGAALQQSLRYLYTHGLWQDNHYEMVEWNLWGNPCLGMQTISIQETPVLSKTMIVLLLATFSVLLIRSQKNVGSHRKRRSMPERSRG